MQSDSDVIEVYAGEKVSINPNGYTLYTVKFNNLKDVLKEAIKVANERADMHDLDTYELNIIKRIIKKYPEILELVSEVQFSPENFGSKNSDTYGTYLFDKTPKNHLKEFFLVLLIFFLYKNYFCFFNFFIHKKTKK